MRIEAGPDFIDLRITEILNMPQVSSRRDIRLECEASAMGGTCRGWCWVDGEHFKAFAAAVERLYMQRLYKPFEDSANLSSISPGEFQMALGLADRRGHVDVHIVIARRAPPTWSMSGSFVVELPDLAELVRWAKDPQIDG